MARAGARLKQESAAFVPFGYLDWQADSVAASVCGVAAPHYFPGGPALYKHNTIGRGRLVINHYPNLRTVSTVGSENKLSSKS
jgi:hypothetical protein